MTVTLHECGLTPALELVEITKRYVGHLAVDRLSLSVPQGSIYGILGPNGAGKSTTLRMVMNIIARDSGSIRVLGADPAVDRSVLRRVGYLPDVIVFFGELVNHRGNELHFLLHAFSTPLSAGRRRRSGSFR